MADQLLAALIERTSSPNFTFQHKLCHDFESLIWVIVYAMMIRHRNTLVATDQVMCRDFKEVLDGCWTAHSYSNVLRSHIYMIGIGCNSYCQEIVSSWFPDTREAAFFRDAMRLLRNQEENTEPIVYESLCTLFKKHIQLANESPYSNVAPN